ncbi:MAG: HDOD domain-containing protein [Lentisphaeraceae bacterium]|nr:HDOD domain-containing protein [Lentisphaeraceae bacterium]
MTSSTLEEETFQAELIVQSLRKAGSLPAYSDNVKSICSTSDDENSNVRDLSKIIMRDAGLTTNILSTINSALYGLKYPVKTVTASVNLLGFDKVRALALGLTLFQETIPNKKDQKLLGLYASSYFAGSFSLALADENKYKTPEEIFVAGLLNQLPFMALANCYPEEFATMERLMADGMSQNDACKEAFKTSYTAICDAVVKMYNLKGKVAEIVSGKFKEDDMYKLVNIAGDLSTMLFNQLDNSPAIFDRIEKELQTILKAKKFDLDEFIKKACKKDDNLQRFFHIGDQEINQLITAIHDPDSSNPMITLGLLFGKEFKEEAQIDEMKKLKQNFITELTMCREKHTLNDILAMSMEALYRCIPDTDIFLLLMNKKEQEMQGRYYMGDKKNIEAQECKVSFKNKRSPIITCLFNDKPVVWTANMEPLHLPLNILSRMISTHAVFLRIVLDTTPVGCFFISRNQNKKFDKAEIDWCSKVVDQVDKGFLKNRSKK